MQENIFIVRLYFKFWKIFALWHDGNRSRLYRIYGWVFHTVFSLLYLGSMVVSILASTSLKQFFIEAMYVALTELAMATKTIRGFVKFVTIIRLHRTAFCEEFQPQSDEERRFMKQIMGRFNVIYMFYLLWSMAAVLSNFSFLFDDQYKLPFFPWMVGIPYGKNLPYNFAFLLFYQVGGMAIHAILNIVSDAQIGYLMTVAGIQMDLLAQRISQMECPRKTQCVQSVFRKQYEKHIAHYNKINEFIKEVEQVYSLPVLSQFCASGITICAIAFRLSSINLTNDLSKAVPVFFYLLSMMVQIFLPCYIGNEVTLRSDQLGNALYSSEWYQMSTRNQQDVRMFMIRSVRPAVLTAGGYFSYNLGTFKTTLNTAYSLFCVLKRSG